MSRMNTRQCALPTPFFYLPRPRAHAHSSLLHVNYTIQHFIVPLQRHLPSFIDHIENNLHVRPLHSAITANAFIQIIDFSRFDLDAYSVKNYV